MRYEVWINLSRRRPCIVRIIDAAGRLVHTIRELDIETAEAKAQAYIRENA